MGRRLFNPIVKVKIGDDEFKTGDGKLRRAEVTLGEDEKASRCSFELFDEDYKIASKYLQASYEQGGLEGLGDTGTNANAGAISSKTINTNLSPNVRAFLDTIAYAEGADYNTIFGGSKFSSYANHPRKLVSSGNYSSDAAGRYQFLSTTWSGAKNALGLKDFSPANQDLGAVYLIQNRGALGDVEAGRFEDAIDKCNLEWASLPGSPYGQPTKSLSELKAYYTKRLATYKLGRESAGKAVNSAVAADTNPSTPVAKEVSAKGTKITVWMGLEESQLVEFSFIHTGTDAKGSDLYITSFEGQSIRWLLTRKVKNATYTNITLKQLAQKVASSYGLTLEMTVDGATYDYLDQTGLTDYQLLLRECDLLGYRIYEKGKSLVVEPRQRKELGFVIPYGDLLDEWHISDKAQTDSNGGTSISSPSVSSTSGELKTVIDIGSGQLKKDGKPSEVKTADGAKRGSAVPKIKPKANINLSDALLRDANKRIKGLPSEFRFSTTEAALLLTPDTRLYVEGIPIDIAWVISSITHSYSDGSLTTSINAYTPQAAKFTESFSGSRVVTPSAPLKPGGFIKPAAGAITSPFGSRWGRSHNGIDIGNSRGTPVVASAEGTVTQANNTCTIENDISNGCGGGYGNYVVISHPNGYQTTYNHLSSVSVSVGNTVSQGQQIGGIGGTGRSTGYHLHFEIIKPGGGFVDPQAYIS